MHKWRDEATYGNSTGSSDSHLEIDHSGLISVILSVLSALNPHFRVGCFPFLSLFLRTVAAYVMAIVCSLYSWLLPLGGVSVSTK